jgi:carbonic anhydrase
MKRIESTSFLLLSVARTTWKGLVLLLLAAATTPRVSANQEQQQAQEEVYFSYSQYNDYGPRRWMLLTFRDATNMCDGSAQSPVKLSKSRSCDKRADVELVGNCSTDDMTFAITMYNAKAVLSSTSESDNSNNSTCFFVQNDKAWRLQSFHVQLGWEHYFGVGSIMVQEYQGSGSHAELHFVHKNEDGDILVVAVWLEGLKSNADNPTFATLLSQWNDTRTIPDNCVAAVRKSRRQLDQSSYDDDSSSSSSSYYPPVNPYALIPSNSAFFSYKGSLTTPPCTEGVAWRVYETVVPISRHQFDWLRDLVITGYIDPATCQPVTAADSLNSTVRPAQHRNGRTISRTCPTVDPARLFFGWATYVMAALALVGVTYVYRRRYGRATTQPKDMDDNPLVPNNNNNNNSVVVVKDDTAPPSFITIPSPMQNLSKQQYE